MREGKEPLLGKKKKMEHLTLVCCNCLYAAFNFCSFNGINECKYVFFSPISVQNKNVFRRIKRIRLYKSIILL